MDKATLEMLSHVGTSLSYSLDDVGSRVMDQINDAREKAVGELRANRPKANSLARLRIHTFQERFSPHQYIREGFDAIEVDFRQDGMITLHYLNVGFNAATVQDLSTVTKMFADEIHPKLPGDISTNPSAVMEYLRDLSSRFWLVSTPSEGGIWCWYVNPSRAMVMELAHSDMYGGDEWASMRDLARKRILVKNAGPKLRGHLFAGPSELLPFGRVAPSEEAQA